jgi:hypothetical protein
LTAGARLAGAQAVAATRAAHATTRKREDMRAGGWEGGAGSMATGNPLLYQLAARDATERAERLVHVNGHDHILSHHSTWGRPRSVDGGHRLPGGLPGPPRHSAAAFLRPDRLFRGPHPRRGNARRPRRHRPHAERGGHRAYGDRRELSSRPDDHLRRQRGGNPHLDPSAWRGPAALHGHVERCEGRSDGGDDGKPVSPALPASPARRVHGAMALPATRRAQRRQPWARLAETITRVP